MLRGNGISYIVAGEQHVALDVAVSLLAEHFGIRTLLLEGAVTSMGLSRKRVWSMN